MLVRVDFEPVLFAPWADLIIFTSTDSLIEMHKDGRIRILGTSDKERSSAFDGPSRRKSMSAVTSEVGG